MTTFSDLTDATLLYLYGFTAAQDQATYLTSSLSASATTVQVFDSTNLSRGILEIGDELLWVDSINANTLTLPPYGRGFRGTAATAHDSGVRVVTNPLFPRKMVKDAINQAVVAVYPMVTAVGSTTFSFSPAVSTYALPAGANNVISVAYQSVGPSKEWVPVRRYRVDSNADTGAFPTGATVSIYDMITAGRTVKVVYAKAPSTMTSDDDVFASVTGLPASMEDVIRLGAAVRLVPFLDAPHLSGMSAEADFTAAQRPVGGAAAMGRFLMEQYQIRLQEEARKQDTLYPMRSHYTK